MSAVCAKCGEAVGFAQQQQVPATEEQIFDLLYANVFADDEGVAGLTAFVEELFEKFDVSPKGPSVASSEGESHA